MGIHTQIQLRSKSDKKSFSRRRNSSLTKRVSLKPLKTSKVISLKTFKFSQSFFSFLIKHNFPYLYPAMSPIMWCNVFARQMCDHYYPRLEVFLAPWWRDPAARPSRAVICQWSRSPPTASRRHLPSLQPQSSGSLILPSCHFPRLIRFWILF